MKTSRGIYVFISLLALACALSACGAQYNAVSGGSQPADTRSMGENTGGYLAPAAPAVVNEVAGEFDGDNSGNDQTALLPVELQDQEQQVTQERVILKDANLNITVQEVAAKVTEIGAMAEEMGGWIVSSGTSQSTAYNGEKLIYGSITVRVPADRLTEALDRIKVGAGEVNSESVSGRDVTQQYVDLSSRLTNLEAAEDQLQTIMDTAKTVEDVLSVYNQLITTRGEIESIRGQLNYYDQASSFSSIAVTINPVAPSPVTTQTTGWSPAKTIENALSTLIGFGQGVVDFVITLVIVILPPVLILGIPAWLIFRRIRRRARASVVVSQ